MSGGCTIRAPILDPRTSTLGPYRTSYSVSFTRHDLCKGHRICSYGVLVGHLMGLGLYQEQQLG